MATVPFENFRELSVAECIQLVQDIWDGVAAEPEAVLLTDEQRQELDRRLAAHVEAPDVGAPWKRVKARILKFE